MGGRQVPDVVVIGGGLAGLRAGVALADQGIRVTLLESRSSLGGRARSFLDPATQEVVDNGQHLFLRGYRQTLQFLERLGTSRHLIFQKRLRVTFVEPPGKVSRLECPALFSPFHFLVGLARFPGLSIQDKLGLLRIYKTVSDTETVSDAESVEEWLIRHKQSERSRRGFWHPLTIATLNEDPRKASALGLVTVLRTLALTGSRDACLGIPSVGLSSLYAQAAKAVIEKAGGKVLLNSPVAQLSFDGDFLREVRLVNGEVLAPDGVVSAVPPSVLARILPASAKEQDPALSELGRWTTSPILSVNLWLDRPVTEELFVGMIGTRFQWFFNKPAILAQAGISANYIALILSAAHEAIDQPNEALVAMALADLKACFPAAQEVQLIRSQVVREREATVSLECGSQRYRPGPATRFFNFFLAGDWTKTGLPATIESAVVSGERAAENLLKWLASGRGSGYNRGLLPDGSRTLPQSTPSTG